MSAEPTFGQRIAAARVTKRGWSQRELAARAGVSKRSVIRWENDQELPRLREFASIVEMLRIAPGPLLRAIPPDVSPYEATVQALSGEGEA